MAHEPTRGEGRDLQTARDEGKSGECQRGPPEKSHSVIIRMRGQPPR